MIVPRDIEGQRRLWRSLCDVFGSGDCPDPPEPEPCVQDWVCRRWTNVISFRENWDDLIRPGSFWGETGMKPDSWYMLLEPRIKCLQIVRIIEYNKSESTIELPGIDGFLMLTNEDVPVWKGVSDPGLAVSFPGQPAEYFMTLVWSEAYLTIDYHLLSGADPPAFAPVEGSLNWEVRKMHSVYLSLWNWGYSQYRPDMDRSVRIMMFTDGGYPAESKRPKVMNV